MIKHLAIIIIYLEALLLNMKLYKRINKESEIYISSLIMFILLLAFQSILLLGAAIIILNL